MEQDPPPPPELDENGRPIIKLTWQAPGERPRQYRRGDIERRARRRQR